ncbi:hypothetical protein SEA_BENCZKOWSKI14_43 [Gordonia phage Benczkowski14]|uniref:Uncharacterized protein n=5 Tax=Demosthenesvirus katyusha TaxID=1982108 RepID=A0A345MCH5_9CAUD|nr:hypothetical protein BH765_gp43 [Gordonia phage Kvothe]YP_009603317.1 hypothetical protein FDH67_gp43 [Gordonia phage Katyusha]AMS03753.1 hypothetical protein SEA_BENCZKOWSKI14_43 [Gordonia phage Benczkowski14]AXH68196.1 hypothetical protein SEA_TEATEALATTE_44 [Gordonia phage Teatealatte]QBP29602.1 hypothetical protein SEA_TREDGE_44 [Gordonia phage Tredge]AMS03436.1 hypothetical protein SEA_KATYUSHA_43 [Gordonia phage Katyusha]ANA86108.1 hypothetical protein PBI_KVOTHE_43 [Gordonia phage K
MELHLVLHLKDGKVEVDDGVLDLSPGEEISPEELAEVCSEEVMTEMENVDGLQAIVNQITAWGFKLDSVEAEAVGFDDEEEYGVK